VSKTPLAPATAQNTAQNKPHWQITHAEKDQQPGDRPAGFAVVDVRREV